MKGVISKQHLLEYIQCTMMRPYSNLALSFAIQVDVDALNYQVEERKLREAIERSKEMAYGKHSRLGQNKGINQKDGTEVGQLCL